jgi:hypothetical protein
MDKFIEELMQETVHFGMYDGDIPDYVIAELLQKHFGIRLDVMNWHGPLKPWARPSNPLIPQIYADVIVDQLIPPNMVIIMGKQDDG